MSVVVLATSGFGYAAYRHFNGQITRIKNITTDSNQPAVTYLITGVDSRAGLNAEVGAGDSAEVAGERTDTMMLVHIPANGTRATIVSFPRDSYVEIPGHGSNKLNAAVPFGGPALLVQTIENLSGIHIDHYVQIDFYGFEQMTDAVGGVTVCLNSAAVDKESGVDLSAGTHTIKGAVALAYVRQRYGLPGGDLDRIKRQQSFIAALIRKVTSAGTLLNPIKLLSFLNAATKSVQVDDSLSVSDMKKLATRLRNLSPSHVTFETFPVSGTGTEGDVGSVVYLNTAALPAFFASVVAEPSNTPSPKPSSTPKLTLTIPPGSISVRVLNGTSIPGKAASVANSLAKIGYAVTGTGNATGGSYAQTEVRYGPNRAQSAQTLAAAIPGSKLVEDPNLGDSLNLVIGSNYTTANPVTIGPATTSPTASPSPTPTTAASTACAPGNEG